MDATHDAGLRACAVRVPCSTSNLGAGFDCIGLAFERYLDAAYLPGDTPLQLRTKGTLAGFDAHPHEDRVASAFRAEVQRRGHGDVGGTLLVTSQIPVGRGLGSSGAAAVAGIALASGACAVPLDRDAALRAAAREEGHPDNAAPSLFGGLVAIGWADTGVPLLLRLTLSPALRFVFAAPDVEVATNRARAVLPDQVMHSAASRNLGRVAALLHGLAHADARALAVGFTDELHVPYRLPLIPGAASVMDAARDAGAWGATISGSGSGMIAVCTEETCDAVLDAMIAAFRGAGHEAEGFAARPDLHGVQPRDPVTLRDAFDR